MATVDIVEFPQPTEENREEILQAIIDYARQNPAKYALKKEALFKKYKITDLADEVVEVPETEDVKELKAIRKATKKTVKK